VSLRPSIPLVVALLLFFFYCIIFYCPSAAANKRISVLFCSIFCRYLTESYLFHCLALARRIVDNMKLVHWPLMAGFVQLVQ